MSGFGPFGRGGTELLICHVELFITKINMK